MATSLKFTVEFVSESFDNGVTAFVIFVNHDHFDKVPRWKIVRTVDQIANLRAQILHDGFVAEDACPFLECELSNYRITLEEHINHLLCTVGDAICKYVPLMNFLDTCEEHSAFMQLQVSILTDQVHYLTNELRNQADKVQEIQTSHYFLFGVVQDLLAGYDAGLKKKLAGAGQHSDLLKSLYHVPSGSSAQTDEERGVDSEANSNRSSLSVNTNEGISPAAGFAPLSDSNTTDRTHSGSSDMAESNTEGSPHAMSLKGLQAPTPVLKVKRFEFAEKVEQQQARPHLSALMLGEEESGSKSTSGSIPSTPHFPMGLHPSAEMCVYYNTSVEHILKVVRPTSAQVHYRHSVITMLKKQVRLGLNCNIFPTGLHDILCSLPDDPICVSVIISKNLVSSWHMCLVDRLNLMSERFATSAGNVDMVFAEEEELLLHLPDDFNAPLRHEITGITHSKLNMSFAVNLQVDSSCEVEILANNRHDLCMLAFLEEMTTLVGKDDLFKRSLLLIRAWWQYETAAYVGTPIKHYVKDSNICVMVCAIFNQYHARISSPLQALCLFLAEYSAYDGATHAITLQGIVPFKSLTSSQPILLDAHNGHLISCEVIEKYWNLFNLSSASVEECDYENIIRSSSSDDVHHDDGSGIAGASIVVRRAGIEEFPDERSAPGGIEKISMKNLSSHNLHYFERHVFNIVHPFNHTNMVAEKLSSRRQMRLHKAFQIGASEITVYLRQSIDNANNSGDLLNYFPNLLAKFGEGKGVAALKDTAEAPVIDEKYYSGVDKLAASIMYCNMMLESVLSEQALLTLSIEILAVKGPLPVGEIGKLLAETTSIGNLSQKLKERFGGLKKFLERFQSSFVISNDHPFNPNVLLRESLSPEHLDLIDRGIFPHQLLLKTKKPVAPTKKKKSTTGVSTAGEIGSSSGSGVGSPMSASNSNSVPNSPFLAQQAHKFMASPSLGMGNHAMSSPNLLQQASGGVGSSSQVKFQGRNPNVVTSPVSVSHKGVKSGSFSSYSSGSNPQTQQHQQHAQGHHQPTYHVQSQQSFHTYQQQMGGQQSHSHQQKHGPLPSPHQSSHMLYTHTSSQGQAQAQQAQAQQQQQQAMLVHMSSQQQGGMGFSQGMNSSNKNNNINMANNIGNASSGGNNSNHYIAPFSVRDNEPTSRGSFNLGSGPRSSQQGAPVNSGGDANFFPTSNSVDTKYFQLQQPMKQQQSSFFDDILSGGGLDASASSSLVGHRGFLHGTGIQQGQSQLLSNLRMNSLDMSGPDGSHLSQAAGALYGLQGDAHMQQQQQGGNNSSGGGGGYQQHQQQQQYRTSPPSHQHPHQQALGPASNHSHSHVHPQSAPAQHLSSPSQPPPPPLTSAQQLFGPHPQSHHHQGAPYTAFDASAVGGGDPNNANLAQRGDSFLRDYSKR